MARRMELLGVALGIAIVGALPACQGGKTATTTGKLSSLSPTERVEYLSDWHYMRSQVAPGRVHQLDLADPTQYRFLERRLKMAGKSPGNSPYLFQFLAAARNQPWRWVAKSGVRSAALTATADAAPEPLHFVTAAVSKPLKAGEGLASASFPSRAEMVGGEEIRVGTIYTYLDVTFSDTNGTPLADLAMAEDYTGGANVDVATPADLTLTNSTSYLSDSAKFEVYLDENGAEQYLSSYTAETRIVDGTLTYDVAVEAPDDIKYSDNLISVCLNRTWTQDCDYDLTGDLWALKLPLKGSITVTSANHTINARAVENCRADPAQCDFNGDMVINEDDGYITLKLTDFGGGCQAEKSLGMTGFWQSATVSPDTAGTDDKVLSWDMTGAAAASFGAGCRQMQDNVSLLMKIRFPVIQNVPRKYTSSVVTVTTPGDNGDALLCCPMQITNSCFAAGTLIEMANGKLVPIESIAAGDRTLMPPRGNRRSLTVTDTAKGVELESMVRIRDETGRSLLMTSMHPIATLDRGMVIAKNLKRGDIVLTKAGPSKLVDVRRQRYDGKVYNLKVGSAIEKASLGPDDTVVFANGFLAGDGQVQARYEQMVFAKAHDSDVLKRLPARWHRDYESYLARQVAQRR
jgi:hypothetical protein